MKVMNLVQAINDALDLKLGDDKNIVTMSFSVKDKGPAEDLVSFLEKGYNFILDADVTPGEQSDGTYKVFVEIERNKDVHGHIMEIMDGVQKLSSLEKMKFRYYKNFKSLDLSDEALAEVVPNDPDNYGIVANESNLNNYKNFFNKSFVESVDMKDDILTIKKKYADTLRFKFIDFGDKNEILENLSESFNPWEFAEIIFLSKYIGDYNITKYGDKLTFENDEKTLVLQRL